MNRFQKHSFSWFLALSLAGGLFTGAGSCGGSAGAPSTGGDGMSSTSSNDHLPRSQKASSVVAQQEEEEAFPSDASHQPLAKSSEESTEFEELPFHNLDLKQETSSKTAQLNPENLENQRITPIPPGYFQDLRPFEVAEIRCQPAGTKSEAYTPNIKKSITPLSLVFLRNFLSDSHFGTLTAASTGLTGSLQTAQQITQNALNKTATKAAESGDAAKTVATAVAGIVVSVGGTVGGNLANEAVGQKAAQKRYDNWGQGVTALTGATLSWHQNEFLLDFIAPLSKQPQTLKQSFTTEKGTLTTELAGTNKRTVPFGICYNDSLCLQIPQVKDPICKNGTLHFRLDSL